MPRNAKSFTLYEGASWLEGSKAAIQIVRHYSEYEVVAEMGGHKYNLFIPEREGNHFFTTYDYDYEAICEMLII